MVAVRINGEQAPLRSEGLKNMADLVELIKASIDPEHMITGILLEGRDLEDSDWSAPANTFETKIVEVQTGTPETFVKDRLGAAWEVCRQLYNEFRDARKFFQSGNMTAGNQALVSAVNTSKAFFEWYGAIFQLIPASRKKEFDINEEVLPIVEVCKRLCQQQLYQSWWALGETIQNELEPKLDKLEDACRKFAN